MPWLNVQPSRFSIFLSFVLFLSLFFWGGGGGLFCLFGFHFLLDRFCLLLFYFLVGGGGMRCCCFVLFCFVLYNLLVCFLGRGVNVPA